MQYVGYAAYHNQVHIEGDIDNWDFVAYYAYDDEVKHRIKFLIIYVCIY